MAAGAPRPATAARAAPLPTREMAARRLAQWAARSPAFPPADWLLVCKMATRALPQQAFAARSQDGGVREAAGGCRPGPGGGQRAGGAGSRGGRRAGERGGVPAAGRRHRHGAGGAAEGAGGAARGARLLPGRLLRAAGAG